MLSKAEQDTLVLEHLYIPNTMARKYKGKVEYEDLVQEGVIGLIKAAQKFDPDKGAKFSTFAYFWVRQAMFTSLTSKSRTIRLPTHVVALKLRIYKFMETFFMSVGFEPDSAIIAKELKVDKYLVDEALANTTEHTGDWEVSEESTIEDLLEREDSIFYLKKLIKTLPDKEKIVLGLKYGFLKSI